MDWNAPTAGYVIAAYGITLLGILALVVWCLARDKAARTALGKIKAEN
ncbi:MAG: heme exporter protein CcmD [Aestuariivirga sp.]